jgi:hypothetical protein
MKIEISDEEANAIVNIATNTQLRGLLTVEDSRAMVSMAKNLPQEKLPDGIYVYKTMFTNSYTLYFVKDGSYSTRLRSDGELDSPFTLSLVEKSRWKLVAPLPVGDR